MTTYKRARMSLIAAAPDLFVALNAVVQDCGKPRAEEYADDIAYKAALSAWDKALAALAKARGDA